MTHYYVTQLERYVITCSVSQHPAAGYYSRMLYTIQYSSHILQFLKNNNSVTNVDIITKRLGRGGDLNLRNWQNYSVCFRKGIPYSAFTTEPVIASFQIDIL
jgi:hypothetical protein